MQSENHDDILSVLVEIRNWIRASAFRPVKEILAQALPDMKSRTAYQMLDGSSSMEQVRVASKMSPNAVVALVSRCISMGLMEINVNKKRVRVFDLRDFGLDVTHTAAEEK